MNKYDEDDIRVVVRDMLKEEKNSNYYYLKNKAYIINAINDDEAIEDYIKKNEIGYPLDLERLIPTIKSIEEQNKEFEKQQKVTNIINNAKELLEKNLDKLIYDEIKYDEFYSNYLKLIKENTSQQLVTKNELEKLEYALSKDEVYEVLEKNNYKYELVFDENNNGFVCIVRK